MFVPVEDMERHDGSVEKPYYMNKKLIVVCVCSSGGYGASRRLSRETLLHEQETNASNEKEEQELLTMQTVLVVVFSLSLNCHCTVHNYFPQLPIVVITCEQHVRTVSDTLDSERAYTYQVNVNVSFDGSFTDIG